MRAALSVGPTLGILIAVAACGDNASSLDGEGGGSEASESESEAESESSGESSSGGASTASTSSAGPEEGSSDSEAESTTTSGTSTSSTSTSDTSASESESEDTEVPTDCTFDVEYDVSTEIGTVGVVTWSSDLPGIDEAYIDFGRDTTYGTRAPVDLSEVDYRTLLLGMVPATDYHFRVTAVAGNSSCQSEDFVLTTEPMPNGVTEATFDAALPDQIAPGFLITSEFTSGLIVIYDHEGNLVWWYQASGSGGQGQNQMSRAKMTHDGKYMVGRNANPSGGNGGTILRVTMDGLTEDSISLASGHHDFTTTPDNGIVFIAGSADNCDEIVKMAEDGTFTPIFQVADAFGDLGGGGGDLCHTNSIHYNAEDETFSFSVLNQNAYVKITADGTLLWVLGGSDSHFDGDGAEWNREHGHHMVAPDRLLFFNNNGTGGGGGGQSLAIEVELDLDQMSATRLWTYEGGSSSMTLGDVQRLANGNTLVTYSNAGLIHEINAERELVQTISWSLGGAVGYVAHRPSLYGPPPP